MIEHKHLKIIQALHQFGTLTEAASQLCLSQSALSHQIRYLENKLEVTLWEREGRTLRLTRAGQVLLQLAQRVLPAIAQAEQTLAAYREGKQGILRIGVECYPCSQWLSRVIADFLPQMPDVEVDIINRFPVAALQALAQHHIDILVTPDWIRQKGVIYETINEYELVLVTHARHPLATSGKNRITPADLSTETLFIFPVPLERLDILTQFLNPAGIQPHKIKEFESFDLMLQMVAMGRGVCVLPQWLAREYCDSLKLHTLRIGKQGIQKELYLVLREADRAIPYIHTFVDIGKQRA